MKQLPEALDLTGDLWVAAPTQHLASLAGVEALLGLDRFDRALPPVHEPLGEPTAQQARVLRNLYRLKPI